MDWYELEIPELDESAGVVIYGAGRTGDFVLEHCRRLGIPCRAVLDRCPDREKEGIPFFRFPEYPAELRSLPVILAVHGEALGAWNDLKAEGFGQVYTMSQFYLFVENRKHEPLPNYALLGRAAEMEAHREAIERAFSLLEDEISRENFMDQLAYRRTGRINFLREPDPRFQYYPDNRPFDFGGPVNFVDCGAFTGDTLEELATVLEFESVTAFEPDPQTFAMLRSFLEERRVSDRILMLQAGVGEQNGVSAFCTGQQGEARFGEGDTLVSVVSMDALFCRHKVDFIKMDIEGAEASALRGARSVIRREQPLLAVSVYHRPEDLWELPLLMKELFPESHLFLRTHRGSFHDTVCYAVPDRFLRRS